MNCSMTSWHFVLFFLFGIGTVSGHFDHEEEEQAASYPLILLSMDGFRYDYLQRLVGLTRDRKKVNHFEKLAAGGVSAPEGVLNVFATKTFPNHYTLVTGLYEETHGVVENFIFDQTLNRTISLTQKNQTGLEKYYHGTPIWVNYGRQKSNDRVACFMWIGCNLPIDNFTLNRVVKYRENVTCKERKSWLAKQLKYGVQLILMYIYEPDHTGHRFGPDSPEMDAKLLDMNECLGQLLSVVPSNVNFLLVSDHGMTTFTKNLTIPVHNDLFVLRGKDYSEWLIDPKPGKTEATISYFKTFDGLKVYKKKEIPQRWHYGHNVHISHILVVAEPGFRLTDEHELGAYSIVAGHGYDTNFDEMRPTFVAHGPSFNSNMTLGRDQLRNVDVYLLVSILTGVEPSKNNGSCDRIRPLLNHIPQIFQHVCSSASSAVDVPPFHIIERVQKHWISVGAAGLVAFLFAAFMVMLHRCLLNRGQQKLRDQFGLDSSGFTSKKYDAPADKKSKMMVTPLLAVDSTDEDDDDELYMNTHNGSASITNRDL